MKTRVMIVDGQVSLRQLLAAELHLQRRYEVVGEAGAGLEAMSVYARCQPELVILDLLLTQLSGSEVLRRLRTSQPQVQVLVYTGSVSHWQIVEALQHRPHGFVEKSDTLETLRAALRAVAAGRVYIAARASTLRATARATKRAELTEREREVLQLVAESRSSKEIATTLGIAVKTVENHRAHAMEKLGVHDAAGLTRFAMRSGWVAVE